ncbi:hypothetical protein [Halobaculum rubrum]|uniref:hypothetical protein n=1 Tax=Halobaculum rubrum TaxID=2872158 RepID=UPI001CA4318A|nr:hypothetical protein [Halobaculum rubrum]QZX98451.1 hypothetical protein K6T25_09130 [Halobaculum rubrum]
MADDPDADGDASDGTDADTAESPRVRNPFSRTDTTDDDRDLADGREAGDASEMADVGDADDEAADRPGDAPLGDLAGRVGERVRDRDMRDDHDPFEEVDVGDIDTDKLWESLGAGEADPSEADGIGQYDPPEAAARRVEEPESRDTRSEHVIDKREYCQRCPYLSAPPDVACGHEDTDILEVVDAQRFRVRGCPIVTADGKPNFAAGDDPNSDTAAAGTAVSTETAEAPEPTGSPADSSTDDA